MTADPQQLDELHGLLGSLAEGSLSAGGIDRIDELVQSDIELLRFYLERVRLVSDLRFGLDAQRSENVLTRLFSGELLESQGSGVEGRDPTASGQAHGLQPVGFESRESQITESQIPNQQLPVPFIVVDNTLPSPLSSSHWPLTTDHSFVFSYLVATVIFGIAGLAGWLYQVEHYTEFARTFGTSSAAVEQQAPAVEKTVRVARVTGLVDCRWSEPETEAFNGSHISLGRRFALSSGLMQLTYDTGAQVILQGPCMYKVDSVAGGFLSLGKLTAKVGGGGGGAGGGGGGGRGGGGGGAGKLQISKSPNPEIPKSQIPKSPNPKISKSPNPQIPRPSPLTPRPSSPSPLPPPSSPTWAPSSAWR